MFKMFKRSSKRGLAACLGVLVMSICIISTLSFTVLAGEGVEVLYNMYDGSTENQNNPKGFGFYVGWDAYVTPTMEDDNNAILRAFAPEVNLFYDVSGMGGDGNAVYQNVNVGRLYASSSHSWVGFLAFAYDEIAFPNNEHKSRIDVRPILDTAYVSIDVMVAPIGSDHVDLDNYYIVCASDDTQAGKYYRGNTLSCLPLKNYYSAEDIGTYKTIILPLSDFIKLADDTDDEHIIFESMGEHPVPPEDNPTKINSIDMDKASGSITINASELLTNGEDSSDNLSITWISEGNLIHTGKTLNYAQINNLGKYVRAVVTGRGGETFTQPFEVIE
jgi:hypothetical protein